MITEMQIENIKSRLRTNWQRVLFRLWIARIRKEKFWLASGMDSSIITGWLPMYALRGKLIGGDSADVRLREDLRIKRQFPILLKNHIWYLYGEKKITPIYRLDCDLSIEEWDEILNNKNYIYQPPISPVIIEKNGQLCFV